MSDPSLELHAALISKLKADAGVSALVGARVYGGVPEGPTFPYISLGPVQVLPDKAECIDGTEVFYQIDGWARDPTVPKAKQLSKAIVAALDDQDIAVSNYAVIVAEISSINHLPDPDGITAHCVLSFRFLIQLA